MSRLPARPSTKRPSGSPFRPGHPKLGGRTKGTPNRVSVEMKEFLKSVIEDPEYQEALRARMIAGKAAHMEQLAAYYTLGKPGETVAVQSPSLAEVMVLGLQLKADEKRIQAEEARAARARGDSLGHLPLAAGDGDPRLIS
jgi:hypothetical protein